MKDKDKKRFKESKIGKIIYGFLMFAPLLAIGVTCGYAMFNKNAYQSYANNQNQYELEEINSYDDLVLYDNYIFEFNQVSSTRGTGNKVAVSNLQFIVNFSQNDYSNGITHFAVSSYDGVGYLLLYNGDYAYPSLSSSNRLGTSFSFDYEGTISTNWSNYYDNGQWFKKVYNSYTLDNVFYYSVDKVTQSNLFNWSKTSNIYTGMHNFTTALNVTNTFIPMLLTYWLIISIIYFLYDIVLILLHIVHRKIHNLQDSI